MGAQFVILLIKNFLNTSNKLSIKMSVHCVESILLIRA